MSNSNYFDSYVDGQQAPNIVKLTLTRTSKDTKEVEDILSAPYFGSEARDNSLPPTFADSQVAPIEEREQ